MRLRVHDSNTSIWKIGREKKKKEGLVRTLGAQDNNAKRVSVLGLCPDKVRLTVCGDFRAFVWDHRFFNL